MSSELDIRLQYRVALLELHKAQAMLHLFHPETFAAPPEDPEELAPLKITAWRKRTASQTKNLQLPSH